MTGEKRKMRSNGDPADRSGRLDAWIGVVRRRWRVGVLLWLPLLALAAALILFARPVYRAQAKVRLGEPPPMSGVSPTAGFFGLMRLGGDPFANDLELLTSRTLTEQVVRDNALNATLLAPRGWHRDSVFSRFEADTTTAAAIYTLVWRPDGRIDVQMTSPRDSVVGTIAPGEPIAFAGVTLVARPLRAGMPERVEVKTIPFGLALLQMGARVRAERSRRDANVVDIEFDGTDPALARGVVASAIDRFIALRTEIQRRESGQTVDSLRVVGQATARELSEAESALERWQRETRLVSPDVQSEVFVTRYGELLTLVEQARAELDAIIAIADRLDAARDTAGAWSALLAFPQFVESIAIGGLVSRLSELEQRRTELATRRAETSREYNVLVDQIRQLDETVRSLVQTSRESLAERLAALQAQADEMDRALAMMPAQAIELGRRTRAIRLLSEVILLTEQRLRQEELRQALTFSNVQIVDPPRIRFKPVWPRRTIGLGVGFLIATAFAVLGMVVTERADRRVRHAAEIEALTGGPVIAATLADRSGLPVLSEDEVRVVTRHAAMNGQLRLGIAPIEAGPHAERLSLALSNGDAPPSGAVLTALPVIDNLAAATIATGTRVALIVHVGRTRSDALARSVRLLETAGASVVGAIVVCDRRRDLDALWT